MNLMFAVLWTLVYPAFAHRHIPREIFVADRIKTRSEAVRRNAGNSLGTAMAQHTVVPSRNAVDAAAPGGSSMADVQDSSQPPKRSQIVDRSEKYGASIGRKVGYVAGNAAYNAQRVAKDVQTKAGRTAYGAAYTAAHPLNVAAAGYGLAVGKMKGAMADLRDIRNKYEEKGYEKHRKRKAEGKWKNAVDAAALGGSSMVDVQDSSQPPKRSQTVGRSEKHRKRKAEGEWKYQSNSHGDPREYDQDGPNTYQDESWQPHPFQILAEGERKYQSNSDGDPRQYGQDGPNTYQDESWRPHPFQIQIR